MKKIILLNFGVLISLMSVFSQDYSTVLKAIDSAGNTDSVSFGWNANATLGIDTFLNEKNIYGKPFEKLDLRVIQRVDSGFPLCGHPYDQNRPILIFENNTDQIVDFRNRIETPFGISNYFTFSLHADSLPVSLIISSTTFLYPYSGSLYLNDSNCNVEGNSQSLFYLNSHYISRDPIKVFSDTSKHNIYFTIFYYSSVQLENTKENSIDIFPTITNSIINIQCNTELTGTLEIINTYGETVSSINLGNEKFKSVDESNLSPGLYYIKYFSESYSYTQFSKFVKY